MSTDADQIFSDRTVSSSGLKWDASPSLVRKCLQNLPGLLRPSRASEKSLRYWREQTEFITCACATHWRRQYELHFSLAGQVGMAMHLGEQDSNCESLVVSQNFVLCQDGLTPCHLMLSLSDRFQDMGPLFKAKRREHGVQDMVHAAHNGLTWVDKALKSSISL
ncbi:uncharacterized protein [Dermacentor andersoni]|uniref:uncharacterized protein isoform X1 n=1 Tax=Dermacentor andersoni TaxID=34620 RepID=UPI002417878C|nr:uncharacterized protein LOC126522305 isoform X2 [Dermacentor andersoni]XP_050041460.2 uncharacterized protein LOC126538775 isoform X2 [Dermacentor andersoni]